MEYHNPSDIVKDFTFGKEGRDKIMAGVNKLTNAVKSTLGASGKCVIFQDAFGRPIITKDGVTVAEASVIDDPVEDMGAMLIKEAAKNTVREAGDGTTTATILAQSILEAAGKHLDIVPIREIKNGISAGLHKILEDLDKQTIPVQGDMLKHVAEISCNNDKELGGIIAEAFQHAGKSAAVLMEESEDDRTYVKPVNGASFDSGLKSSYFVTDKEKEVSDLLNPFVLIATSPIANIRKIESILAHVLQAKRPLLIIGQVEQQAFATLLANKMKGILKVNIIDEPGFGNTKQDTLEDLATLTGATIINEEMGDSLDLLGPEVLGEAIKVVTSMKDTVLQFDPTDKVEKIQERLDAVAKKLKKETNPYLQKKLEQRQAILSGSVALLFVGANSKIELKEKKDRVEDAIFAVKAAIKEGVVSGGGVALKDAVIRATTIVTDFMTGQANSISIGEKIIYSAAVQPMYVILENAELPIPKVSELPFGMGIDAINGKVCNMIESGIVDPVLVTKTALKNAVSVATTILSADCIISNKRIENASS